MRSLVPVAVCLLVAAAGCGAPVSSPSPTPTGVPTTDSTRESVGDTPTTPATHTATRGVEGTATSRTSTPNPTVTATPVPLQAAGTPCDEDLWIDFWRPQNDKGGWTQSNVRVSYTLPANASIFLVAYVDGRVAGVSFDADYGTGGYHVDGYGFDLDRTLDGHHLVQVVVYTDENENRQFDRDVDSPCLVDGDVAQAGPSRLNYSQYEP